MAVTDQANDNRDEEIMEEVEKGDGTSKKLMDFIPIYIPPVENNLLDQTPHDRRFLDFLKAHPSKDWFLRCSPFSFLSGNSNARRRRFRVPFARKINWEALIQYCKEWIKNPKNMAIIVWLLAVGAVLLVLLLFLSGVLNHAIPQSSQRKRWVEVNNQILNVLFTIMCLYQHPRIAHHLFLLCRWKSDDIIELRKIYCKNTTGRPHERAHLTFVVVLLHITCFAQYAVCGIYWGYSRTNRPDFGTNFCLAVGIASPVIAGVYTVYGPLGGKYQEEETTTNDEESQQPQRHLDMKLAVTRPQWVGGLFDCWDDMTVAYLSFFCTFCVFGWNMERLGFGNMYVHIITFVLLCMAPFWVFNVAGLNVDDDVVREMVGIFGIVLSFLGLLYGGFWRMEMRKRFKLPSNTFCFGYAGLTDFMQWLFCCSCSLAQEVRTGNFYDVGEYSFYRKKAEEEGGCDGRRQVLVPLPREGGGSARFVQVITVYLPARSQSCPSKIAAADLLECGKENVMAAPVPPVMEMKGDLQRCNCNGSLS